MNHLKPADILERILESAEVKSKMPLKRLIIFGIFAGVYIAFAGAGANMASFNLLANPETFGLGKILSGTTACRRFNIVLYFSFPRPLSRRFY